MSDRIRFRPEQIHPSVFVARGAVVLGDVTLEEEASVWFTAVVRGDTEAVSVGRQSNIQDGCVLHADAGFPCRIGARVTIGHRAIVHGATVEDEAMIGMGAIVLNGAKIGRHSIVGAGALVPEGFEAPPRSLILGVPGKVRREISDDEAEYLRQAALHYVRAAAEFAAIPELNGLNRPADDRPD